MQSTHIIVDLGFGDAGKGTMVDALARRCSSPPLVVRHNGGAQAGHRVVTSDGKDHVFSQFGAATFVPQARTLLSKHFILHPNALLAEHEHLLSLGVTDAFSRLFVDARALVITPWHQAMNRLREMARGSRRHGTCGVGIGETVSDGMGFHEMVVRAGDMMDRAVLVEKFEKVRQWKLHQLQPLLPKLKLDAHADDNLRLINDPESVERTADHYADIAENCLRITSEEGVHALLQLFNDVIFEGAQGVLLDEWHGFHPHTTWSTTTTANADRMIAETFRQGPVTRWGVVRAYATRHGQGPMPTEHQALTKQLRDAQNVDTGWQGRFRVGWFDIPLTRYALSCCPTKLDGLVVTCLDRLAEVGEWKICHEYEPALKLRSRPGDLAHQERLTRALGLARPKLKVVPSNSEQYVRVISEGLDLPIAAMSFGPTAEDKTWL